MSAPTLESAAAFWLRLNAEAERNARDKLTREVKVRPQYRIGANDEPELSEADRKLAAGFAGEMDGVTK